MPRYDRAQMLVSLVLALQAPGRGLSIPQIQERFEVSRRTAERLRDAVARLYPDLWWEAGPDGRRYWKLRRGVANDLVGWSLEELVALEWALRRARAQEPCHVPALEGLVEKVRALIRPCGTHAPATRPGRETGHDARPAPLATPPRAARRGRGRIGSG
jgi:predicted DNA-binding transcriptional regulator YafY